ncbi:MAG: heme lyase CcmF/NrfE family subunit [Deltaproteobacteria bacterium]|nr:heme lyase CcmF/NrfE family subunit [Deltaproteobacteria bacterium]
MVDLGLLSLRLALIGGLYAVLAAIYGAVARRPAYARSARQAAYAVHALVAVAALVLWRALVTRDFSLEYVASYASSTLSLPYRIAALWGGQAGSLLFWALILTTMSTVVHLQNRERNAALMPYVTATLMAIAAFFLGLLVFMTSPFERLPVPAAEGADLNPLLQNYWMLIHPPALYLGYVGCSVPFAFAIAALATGRLGDVWIRTTRRWTLFAWFFLTLGNMLGARWAYEELGWGGYWAWDPVENAAFMPWLSCTAFLHSVMIQEKKNMLKMWNMVLVLLTFCLTIFGTFLTRSGVVSSVHSFTQSGLGPFFVAFLLSVIAVVAGLVVWRRPLLRGENEIDSFLSREAAFLFNNLLLVGIAFATFWGTVFPVISEAVRGIKITVGPPFFNKVNAPLGLALLFMTGVGPVIAWRRASARNLRRSFAVPLGVGFATGAAIFASGWRNYYAVVCFSLAVFVLATIFMEFYRGTRARQALMGEPAPRALANLVGKNRRRYGGYVIHVGVVMVFVGVAASSAFRLEEQETIRKGDVVQVGAFTLTYQDIHFTEDAHYSSMLAEIAVAKNGAPVGTLFPEKRFYKKQQQPTTEVALRSTLAEDLYLVLGSYDDATGLMTMIVFVNPLVNWLWIGGLVMVLGTVIVMSPTAAEQRALAAALAVEERGLEAALR